ncbi:MAG TPA: MEDS domain-containing protein [Thermoanaerobaculia bacterium]|nr:MEDS domain-containing protein [Thermoanaerobaculia bacterium]
MSTTYDAPLVTALEQVAPHDHLSLVYERPEDHYAVAVPFIRIGLERGEKCIYIADDGTQVLVRDAMVAQGIDVEQAMATQKLVLETKEGPFLKHGAFDPERMPRFWKDATTEAVQQGFSALRATGETEWLVGGASGVDRWVEYESRLTQVLAGLNCFALCQYNLKLLPPDLVLDVIRTHPTIIYRGVICPNMYYVPPDEFLGTNQAAREVERLLATIRERAEIEQTLTKQRNELRTLANRLMHAQDDERRRIATMLHETTAQDLAALKMLLARLSRTADRLSLDERNTLTESISLAEQSMAGIRTVSYLLHPPFLDEAGLLSALRWYARGFSERSGIKVDLDLPENIERLPLDTETVLFRIVQESLTNIHRHAGSETAQITLRRDSEMLMLEIEDRGRGIPNASIEHITSGGSGVGIAGMSERMHQLGGRLDVTSSDHGTTVRVRLPLARDTG